MDLGEWEVWLGGGDVDTLQAWSERLHAKNKVVDTRMVGIEAGSESDSPLTEYGTDTGG